MPTIDILDAKKQKVGDVELSEKVFDAPLKAHLLHEVVVWQLACRRSGNAHTKTRSEVRGGGRKPWRQKGTGRARAGTRRSPLWRGGGTTFGPRKRDYGYRPPKKVRKAALRVALSDKLREEQMLVLRDFGLTEIKTKVALEVLNNLESTNTLVVTGSANEMLEKSLRNLPKVKLLKADGLNVYDILKYDRLLLMEDAVQPIEEALA